jgi:RimJ/RimL family protein N-acetyltransferase
VLIEPDLRSLLVGRCAELEPLTVDDAEDVLSLRNDPEYNRHLSHPGTSIRVEDQRLWLKDHCEREDEANFKIRLDGRFVGTISLYDIADGTAEFGRYLAKNPIASLEAELLLLQFGFEGLRLESIFCKTLEANQKVWRQHESFGFDNRGLVTHPELGVPLVHQVLTLEQYQRRPFGKILELIERFA